MVCLNLRRRRNTLGFLLWFVARCASSLVFLGVACVHSCACVGKRCIVLRVSYNSLWHVHGLYLNDSYFHLHAFINSWWWCDAKIWKTQNSLPFSSVRKMDYKNFGQNLMFHGWNNMILFLLHLTICYANFLGEIEDLRFLTLERYLGMRLQSACGQSLKNRLNFRVNA